MVQTIKTYQDSTATAILRVTSRVAESEDSNRALITNMLNSIKHVEQNQIELQRERIALERQRLDNERKALAIREKEIELMNKMLDAFNRGGSNPNGSGH